MLSLLLCAKKISHAKTQRKDSAKMQRRNSFISKHKLCAFAFFAPLREKNITRQDAKKRQRQDAKKELCAFASSAPLHENKHE
ncbi:MAG: hypothetical protein M3040_01295 [Bacteroidota bacterium]|nr:hypothetical protein [Bacteroidota bacterium]